MAVWAHGRVQAAQGLLVVFSPVRQTSSHFWNMKNGGPISQGQHNRGLLWWLVARSPPVCQALCSRIRTTGQWEWVSSRSHCTRHGPAEGPTRTRLRHLLDGWLSVIVCTACL